MIEVLQRMTIANMATSESTRPRSAWPATRRMTNLTVKSMADLQNSGENKHLLNLISD